MSSFGNIKASFILRSFLTKFHAIKLKNRYRLIFRGDLELFFVPLHLIGDFHFVIFQLSSIQAMKQTHIYLLLLPFLFAVKMAANNTPEFSTAGFYTLENSPRQVANFNVGWRFHKGDVAQAHAKDFDDKSWALVNLPHGLEYLPAEASGGINYQGRAWYRKSFELDKSQQGQKIFIHFEALMGKSQFWVNGQLLKTHFGGFLPVVLDVTEWVDFDQKNKIAVLVDNADDKSYPPGKPQYLMDFAYLGGLYRDAWLITTSTTHITDANHANTTAGGGTFIHVEKAHETEASLRIITEIHNESNKLQKVKVEQVIMDSDGRKVAHNTSTLSLPAEKKQSATQVLNVKHPKLWTPHTPYRYDVLTTVYASKNKIVDSYKQKIGLRTIEFRGKEGFFLNGMPYGEKLIGGNRHQDFALIGNALPNSLHWRDAKKLRDAGFTIIRSAHYPQDPAFMDACDELGLFVIVATPGWQFWPGTERFEQRVYNDIRQMVRRDRNHPCVIMWEPILNETRYPDAFAKEAHRLIHEEYPFSGAYAACDERAAGSHYYDVIYGTVGVCEKTDKAVFTREWGDNVCDWSAHNSTSRVAREWGEEPMLLQATHYSKPRRYDFYALETLYDAPPQFVGGTLWHSFDHQRGYHPDPFYGGIMDAFRQPKTAYTMFKAQRHPYRKHPIAESGVVLEIAHDMNPFSPPEVTVFSNCDSVKLSFLDKKSQTISRKSQMLKQPHPPMYFPDMYNFQAMKHMHRKRQWNDAHLVATGYLDGEIAAQDTQWMVEEVEKLILIKDDENLPLIADGSDIVVLVAAFVDERGGIKRLNNRYVSFEIEGEGEIIASHLQGVNPQKVAYGTAPILIRSTQKAGSISVKAKCTFEGEKQPLPAELSFESIPATMPFNYSESPDYRAKHQQEQKEENKDVEAILNELRLLKQAYNKLKTQEVEQQQTDFENKY